jgi:tetratricopeptide (TPR) repeat protein
MREVLPPMDNLARALLMRGAREPAMMLLKAAVRRGGDERARCESLLMAVQARPTDRVSGPPITLDAGLVESVAGSGRLYEAHAIALGADISRNVAGVEIAAALTEVFLPVDDWAPGWRVRWLDALASGVMSSMTGLEREASVATDPPPALRPRVAIALRLLRGFSLTGATDVRDPLGDHTLPILSDDARERILSRINGSDLPGALREAHAMAFEGRPGTNEVAIVLGRLLHATERAMQEAPQQKLASTVPLGGPGMALFQLRMGNFAESQRLFRQMVLESPTDYASREHLTDLMALEQALGLARSQPSQKPLPVPEPPSRAPSTDWLDKRGRKSGVEGWAASAKPPPDIDWNDDDDSTSVMKSDHEAELHLKAGHPERALALYEELVKRFPDRPRFAQRKAEIEAMLEARSAPIAMEPTIRRDVLPAAALKGPATRAPAETPPAPIEERQIDPLAQTNKDTVPPEASAPVAHPALGPRGAGAAVMPLGSALPASRPRARPSEAPKPTESSSTSAARPIEPSRPAPLVEPSSKRAALGVHQVAELSASLSSPRAASPVEASPVDASGTVAVRRIVPVW